MKVDHFLNIALVCLLLSSFGGRAIAQRPVSPMDDQRVYQLCKNGLHADEVIAIIMAAPDVNFELSPGSTDALLRGGVPDRVVKAMAARMNGTAVSALPGGSPGTVTFGGSPEDRAALPPFPDETGIYFRQGAEWTDVPPEIINWQTGGVVKRGLTLGIIKGDVNGRIPKPNSPTQLTTPIQLLVYALEDTAISEYQLLRLRTHPDAREFRTVTGGVFHVSGGAKRDTFDLESVKIARRMYLVKLPVLGPGEYGILPPGATIARSASEQFGKMFTFRVR
jgi:hypothetical protein